MKKKTKKCSGTISCRCGQGYIFATIDVPTFLTGVFYKNCKRRRREGANTCGCCPFRKGIEDLEFHVRNTR